MRRFVAIGWLIIALALPGLARAAEADSTAALVAPDLGPAQAYVTDEPGLLDAGEQARIEGYLGKVERELGAQFALVIVSSTQPQSPEEYSEALFKKWGIGGAKEDEGLLLLVAVVDRKVRFEVGYGLEGVLPDGRVGGIIRRQITPAFKQGAFADGMLAGLVEAARYVAESKGLPPPLPDGGTPRPKRRTRELPPFLVLFIFVVVVMIVMAVIGNNSQGGSGRRGRRGGYLGPGSGWGGWTTGGLGGGFGGFGGGGFGGGSSGGSSGGFGGFGGGSSGGGGATGSW